MKALFEVFYRPGALFSELPERKNAWVVPAIVDALWFAVIGMLIAHFIGFANLVRPGLEARNMPPEQMEKMLATMSSPVVVYAINVANGIAASVFLLALAGALTIFSMMTGRQPKFGSMYSMVVIAFFPYLLIGGLMTALVLMISPDPASLDPRNIVATNLAAFIDKNTVSKGMYALMGSIDLLSFGEIGLLSYGFSRLTRSGIFAGLGAVITLWVMYVAVRMAMSAIS